MHSGLIAKNHDELEFLKHKGDRNYFEFKLKKKQRSPIATVSLELRKTDPKKSRFTLNVYADDHTIEKKDRTPGRAVAVLHRPRQAALRGGGVQREQGRDFRISGDSEIAGEEFSGGPARPGLLLRQKRSLKKDCQVSTANVHGCVKTNHCRSG